MIRAQIIGDTKHTDKMLKKIVGRKYVDRIKYLCIKGVERLKEATPVRSGLTANSWEYVITVDKGKIDVTFTNDNLAGKDQLPVAILIQYGHLTRDGYYIRGIDYINPALKPIFEELAKSILKEVTS